MVYSIVFFCNFSSSNLKFSANNKRFFLFLGIDKKKTSDGWFCERVFVKNEVSGQEVEFQVFNWLLTELWIVAGEGFFNNFYLISLFKFYSFDLY